MNQDEQGTYRLQDSGRYCHAKSYVESSLTDAGFRVMAIEETPIRMDSHKPVIGLLFVAKKEEGDVT
jgi:predicted TPR repeat methyltransferase